MEASTRPNLATVKRAVKQARENVAHLVQGMDDTMTLLMVAAAGGGHVLMEGLPGVGKTTLAKAFADVTGLSFSRIQLTPDLMPSDITGHTFFDQKTGEFEVRKGPVFTNILLADEMNRTPPRTQSALLEVMQEGQVTIEGQSLQVPQPFMVVATKNPIEIEGVYPLPEAERDRFMVETHVGYPSREVEAAIVDGFGKPAKDKIVEPVENLIPLLRDAVAATRIDPDVRDYALAIVRATRSDPRLEVGSSPRGAIHLVQAAKAHAVLDGRPYVVPDDVRDLVIPVLRHRVVLTADAEIQETSVIDVIDGIIESIPVPVAIRK